MQDKAKSNISDELGENELHGEQQCTSGSLRILTGAHMAGDVLRAGECCLTYWAFVIASHEWSVGGGGGQRGGDVVVEITKKRWTWERFKSTLRRG